MANSLELIAGVLSALLGTIGLLLVSDKSSSLALLSFFGLIISPRLLSEALGSRGKAIVVVLVCLAGGYLLGMWLEAKGYSV